MLRGTDSIWYGSPPDHIQACRAFEITAEAQERFGDAALSTDVKAGILAGNAARLYRVDVLLGPDTASEARRVFAADHPWF